MTWWPKDGAKNDWIELLNPNLDSDGSLNFTLNFEKGHINGTLAWDGFSAYLVLSCLVRLRTYLEVFFKFGPLGINLGNKQVKLIKTYIQTRRDWID